MAQISFYKQVRNDGGVRTGIQIDGRSAWMHFDNGSGIDDSVLSWYIDVEFTGDALHDDVGTARERFLDSEDQVVTAVEEVVEGLKNEDDELVWPVSSKPVLLSDGVSLKVVCSAIRGIRARDLANELSDLTTNWHQQIDRLGPVDHLGRAIQSST